MKNPGTVHMKVGSATIRLTIALMNFPDFIHRFKYSNITFVCGPSAEKPDYDRLDEAYWCEFDFVCGGTLAELKHFNEGLLHLGLDFRMRALRIYSINFLTDEVLHLVLRYLKEWVGVIASSDQGDSWLKQCVSDRCLGYPRNPSFRCVQIPLRCE